MLLKFVITSAELSGYQLAVTKSTLRESYHCTQYQYLVRIHVGLAHAGRTHVGRTHVRWAHVCLSYLAHVGLSDPLLNNAHCLSCHHLLSVLGVQYVTILWEMMMCHDVQLFIHELGW